MIWMQSTGQTVMQASQPVHMSSSRRARTFGSFFFAIFESRRPLKWTLRALLHHRRPDRSTLDANVDFAALELHLAILEGKEGVVMADTHVESRLKLGATLADDDRAGRH